MLINVLNLIFITYTILLFARIIGSWLPFLQNHKIMHFIYMYTEPYLKIFRKLIPPIGGVLDLSPLLAFFALKILKTFVFSLL